MQVIEGVLVPACFPTLSLNVTATTDRNYKILSVVHTTTYSVLHYTSLSILWRWHTEPQLRMEKKTGWPRMSVFNKASRSEKVVGLHAEPRCKILCWHHRRNFQYGTQCFLMSTNESHSDSILLWPGVNVFYCIMMPFELVFL